MLTRERGIARNRKDKKADEIVGVLLGMMDYQLWIDNIFDLKRNSRLVPLSADPGAAECRADPSRLEESGFAIRACDISP